MKPELLFVSRKWPPAVGGMETYARELKDGLEESFQTTVLVLPGRPNGKPPTLLGYAAFLAKAMLYCLLLGRRYSRVIFTDLILFPAAVCHWLVAPKASRIVVVYGLDLVYGRRTGALPALYEVYFRLFLRLQGLFRGVVAISSYTAKLAGDAGIRNIQIINPALPLSALTAIPVSYSHIPVSDGHRRPFILYFGRLVPRKGALWFAQEVLPSLPDGIDFLVAGGGTDNGYCEALRKCHRTTCLGTVPTDDLRDLIRSAAVVVMPNVSSGKSPDVEGFGLAAIEATSLGARLFASRTQGITDAVLDGVTGRLLDPENSEQWITEITHAINNPNLFGPEDRQRVAEATRLTYSRRSQAEAFRDYLLEDGTRTEQ